MDHPGQKPGSIPYDGPERRLYQRRTVQVPIELEFDDNSRSIRAETTDLSRNGCYFRLLSPLPVGLRIRATLWLDDVPVHVRGRVVTRHPEYGNGVMFLQLEEGDENALAAYLESVITESAV